MKATCKIFSTFEMKCFLCGAVVPPNTPHSCEITESAVSAPTKKPKAGTRALDSAPGHSARKRRV